MKYISQREHGQSIVLITLLLIGLIAMLGLILDGGNAYVKRRNMQNAADAAALAGGRQLALANGAGDNSGAAEILVKNAINNYTTANGGTTSSSNLYAFFVDQSNISKGRIGANGGIPDGTTGVSVTISTQFPTYFLGVVNISTGDVGAHTLVQTGAPSGETNLFPVAVPTATLTNMTPSATQCRYDLVDNPECEIWGSSYGSGSSGWTCFHDPNCGSSDLVDYENGTKKSGTIEIGDWINTKTGVDGGAGDLTAWLTPTLVFVPVFDDWLDVGGGKLQYRVASFAVFQITGYYFSGSNNAGSCPGTNHCTCGTDNKIVCGKFQRFAQSGDFDITKKCKYSFCGFQMWQ